MSQKNIDNNNENNDNNIMDINNDNIDIDINDLDDITYKIHLLTKNKTQTIYVFYGNKYNKISNDTIIQKVFTEKEREEITKTKIQIVISNQKIHMDDTISTIKIKLLNELKKKEVLFEELYLFCKKLERLNSANIYQILSQNRKINITKLRLLQFLQNIYDLNGEPFDLETLSDKEIYSYNDIFELGLDNKQFIVDKVLGQKFFIVENEYPFVCNPYDVQDYDTFLEQNARKSLSTLNNYLLLNSGNIIHNNIYLCLAPDVLSYMVEQNISEQTTLKIYYPFLYTNNINSLAVLNDKREILLKDNKQKYNEKLLKSFKTIDLFYDMFYLKKNALDYVNKGIQYINIVMKPDFSIKFPLEILFKIIHATKTTPLIKYNPSSKQENIYR